MRLVVVLMLVHACAATAKIGKRESPTKRNNDAENNNKHLRTTDVVREQRSIDRNFDRNSQPVILTGGKKSANGKSGKKGGTKGATSNIHSYGGSVGNGAEANRNSYQQQPNHYQEQYQEPADRNPALLPLEKPCMHGDQCESKTCGYVYAEYRPNVGGYSKVCLCNAETDDGCDTDLESIPRRPPPAPTLPPPPTRPSPTRPPPTRPPPTRPPPTRPPPTRPPPTRPPPTRPPPPPPIRPPPPPPPLTPPPKPPTVPAGSIGNAPPPRELTIKEVLAQTFDSRLFNDLNSPQGQAIAAIEQVGFDLPGELSEQVTIVQQYYALKTLYFATGGDTTGNEGWKIKDGWNTNNGDYCTWFRVTCSDSKQVTKVELAENNLEGHIPSEILGLQQLEVLYVYNNGLLSVPSELGMLASLVELDLSYNDIAGQIPTEFGNLRELEVLGINYNLFTGLIPSELGRLSNLENLLCLYNELTGAVPTEFGQLQALKLLQGDYNLLTGLIPTELGRLTNLETLTLFFNDNIISPIPTEFGKLTNLVDMDLSYTQLTGGIPSELGNLQKLEFLSLQYSGLTGVIPTELGNLDKLTDLILDSNSLIGKIPTELGNIGSLAFARFDFNDLTGNMPVSVCGLRNAGLVDLRVDCERVSCSCCTVDQNEQIVNRVRGSCLGGDL